MSVTPSALPSLEDDPAAAGARTQLKPIVIKVALTVMLGSVAAGLDSTITGVAIETLSKEFEVSIASVQWVSTAYLLALTVVVPITGWAAERFGARRMWLFSLGLFFLGSMLCGLAWSLPSLTVFRIVQGLGGGMLLPLGRLLLARVAGQDGMGRAMIYVATPATLAPVLAPVLAGFLIDAGGWRWVFYINLPLCVLGLVMAWMILPLDHRQRKQKNRVDVIGLALLTFALASLVYGLSEAGNYNSFAPMTAWGGTATGLVTLLLYGVNAFLSKNPIIDLRLFKVRSFSAASIMLFLLMGSMFGSAFLLPLYYQQVHHLSVLQTGLLFAPLGIGKAISIIFAGKLVDRTGAERAITLTGMAIAVAGLVPFAFVDQRVDDALLIGGLFMTGLGQGAVTIAAFTATYRGLKADQMTAATSANRILQQLGGVLGTVLLAIVLTNSMANYPPATAFAHTFRIALAAIALAFLPALALKGRK